MKDYKQSCCWLAETFEEVDEEIRNMFSKAGEDISEIHDTIWPAVMRWETFFRKSNDVRALELQVELLMMMGDNIYRGAYLTDAYTVCKRILEIDPNREAAKNTIENHIIPEIHDKPYLEKHFNEAKDNNYDRFLDDWRSSYKLVTQNSDGEPDEWDGFVTSDKGTRYQQRVEETKNRECDLTYCHLIQTPFFKTQQNIQNCLR